MVYDSRLKRREKVAAGTMAFYFERPKDFNFIAGQHAVLELIDPPETDSEGNKRVFCFASAPYEKDLAFAMRMRDTAFKRVLKTMPLGNAVMMTGPYGSFVLHADSLRPAVFLVGGIGITPVRSMLLQAAHDQSPREFYLFYSNRRLDDAAFLNKLKRLALSNYKFIPIMSNTESYINKATLDRNLTNLHRPIYYTVGPPNFVLAMRGMLNESGINPTDIKTDQFSGY